MLQKKFYTLEVRALSIDMPTQTVYVRLLDEGVNVYRPVPASEIGTNTFRLHGLEFYDSTDETWEFPPESVVRVELQSLSGDNVLVAVGIV